MSSCLVLCRSDILPKYEQHILNLYPNKQLPQYKQGQYSTLEQYAAAQPDGYKPRNISDVVKYSEMYPNKLPKIGQSLYNKTVKHINKQRPTLACIGLYALLSLIESCHSDDVVTLYDEHVLNIIQYVLTTKANVTTVQQKQLAFELIVKLMLIHENGVDYYKYDGLWAYIVRYLATSSTAASAVADTAKLRYSCIRACTALCANFDTHRASVHYGAVIPLLLNNIHSSTAIVELNNIPMDPSWLDNTNIDTVISVKPSATELSTYTLWCYRTIVDTVTLSDLESVLKPILLWLDSQQWRDHAVSTQLLLTIANPTQLPYIDLVTLRLLQHINYIKQLHNTPTVAHNNQASSTTPRTERASSIELQSVTTYTPAVKTQILQRVAAVITDIMKRAKAKINNYQAVLDNILNTLVNTTDTAEPLDSAYIDQLSLAVQSLVAQLSDSQAAINILQSVLQRYHIHITRASSSDDQSQLLQLALKLSLLPACNLNTKYRNDKLVVTVIIAALCSRDLIHRNTVYNILLNILLPLRDNSVTTFDALLAAIHSNNTPQPAKHAYIMPAANHTWLVSLLYYELASSITTSHSDNTDITCHITDTGMGETNADITVTVWRVLILLLLQSTTERLAQQYPMIHKLASISNVAPVHKLRIEVFVFAYATYVSLLYEQHNNKLAKHLDGVLIDAYNQYKADHTQQQCDVTLADKQGLIVRTLHNDADVFTYRLTVAAAKLLQQLADSDTAFEPSNFKYIIPELHNTIDLSISYAPSHILLQRSESTVLDTNDAAAAAEPVADQNVEPISETQAGIEARGGLTQQPSTSILSTLDEQPADGTVQPTEPERTVNEILQMNGTHGSGVKLSDIQLSDSTDLYDSTVDVALSNKLVDLYNNRWKQYGNSAIKTS